MSAWCNVLGVDVGPFELVDMVGPIVAVMVVPPAKVIATVLAGRLRTGDKEAIFFGLCLIPMAAAWSLGQASPAPMQLALFIYVFKDVFFVPSPVETVGLIAAVCICTLDYLGRCHRSEFHCAAGGLVALGAAFRARRTWARSLNINRPALLRGLEAGAYGLAGGSAALYSHANYKKAAPYAVVYATVALLVVAIKGWESRARLREEERIE